MSGLTTTDLARELDLSKGRISQLVSQKKLEGCYVGEGRQRRFDLAKVARALGRNLDPGQMMGNGASTRAAIDKINAGAPADKPAPDRASGATALPGEDEDRYQIARTLKAEEEARRMRRQNAVEEGLYVLQSEVVSQTRRLIAQEVAEFETVLRDGARRIADDLGVDFKTARQILRETWRGHRERRARLLNEEQQTAAMTDAEREADI